MMFVPMPSVMEWSDNIYISLAFAKTLIISNKAILFSQNDKIMQSLRNTPG